MSEYQNKIHVRFSGKAGHELEKCERKLGLDYSKETICSEIGFYIAAHEAVGIQFDSECQQIDYGEGLVLLLQKQDGKWEVIEVLMRTAFTYVAVWVWKRVARGAKTLLRKVVAAWRMVPRRSITLTPEFA